MKRIWILLCTVLCLSFSKHALSEEGAPRVQVAQTKKYDLVVEGNTFIDEESIMMNIAHLLNVDSVEEYLLNEIVKTLFATQLFSDVKASINGQTITVIVEENTLIAEIVFEGNQKIKTNSLEKEIQLKPKTLLSQKKLNDDIQRIMDIYHASGRFNTYVDASLLRKKNGQVILVFQIEEGEKSLIQHVRFLGNQSFADDVLQGVLFSQKASIFNLLTKKAKYDADIMHYNEEMLRLFYTNRGFPDFQIISSIAELNDAKSGIQLTFSLDEGQYYLVGNIEVSTTSQVIEDFDLSSLQESFVLKTGSVFNQSMLNYDVELIRKKLNDMGYAFAEVTHNFYRHPETGVIDITFIIQESQKVYIETIEIFGNTRTLDRVIRRELEIADGDPFNANELRLTYRKLMNLDYFSNINFETLPMPQKDKVKLRIGVEEKKTGQLMASLSLSSQEGIIGSFSIDERNFMGRGQIMSMNIQKSTASGSAKLSVYEPYFASQNILAGFTLFGYTHDKREHVSYASMGTGFSLLSSFSLKESLTMSAKYTAQLNRISDVEEYASRFIKMQEGDYTISQVGYGLRYSYTDTIFRSTYGFSSSFKQDLAGFFGEAQFFRTEASASYFRPILPATLRSWTFRLSLMGGYIAKYGDSFIRLSDRFYLGGDSFRGFDYRGIGARDALTDDSLGGNSYSKFIAQVEFPLMLAGDIFVNKLNIKTMLYFEAGTLYNIDTWDEDILDSNKMRASFGIGFLWHVPAVNVPVRIDFAGAIFRQPFDKTRRFHFSTTP